jgi:hypothetical protein
MAATHIHSMGKGAPSRRLSSGSHITGAGRRSSLSTSSSARRCSANYAAPGSSAPGVAPACGAARARPRRPSAPSPSCCAGSSRSTVRGRRGERCRAAQRRRRAGLYGLNLGQRAGLSAPRGERHAVHLALSGAHAQLQALDCGCVARDCSASSWISLRSPRAPGATQSTLSPRGQRYERGSHHSQVGGGSVVVEAASGERRAREPRTMAPPELGPRIVESAVTLGAAR